MDHREYIELYLSADADDELSPEERAKASAHLAECAQCRERLEAERALKTMIRAELPILRTPHVLRERIRAGMDEADATGSGRRRLMRRPVTWAVTAALAACLALVMLNLRGQPANPLFDSAIASYRRSQAGFTPAAGARSVDDLAQALINQFGVAMVWDFSSVGMAPVGGRVERTAEGKPVAYAMYQGHQESLLCIIRREDVMPHLSGGTVVKGIHIYKYKGLTIAATTRYSVFCVMVTNLPADQIAQVFAKQPS